jgi:S1-C subfamily serine protease
MVGNYVWTLKDFKENYGDKMGQKIHDSPGVLKVRCTNPKCAHYNEETEIPNEGGGLLYCFGTVKGTKDLACAQVYKVPKEYDYNEKRKEEVRKKAEVERKEEGPSTNSFGTGFFVSNKGHIITNFHVVRNSNNIKFIYNDDEVDAKLIESDQQLDLALLKSKVENKNYIKFSNKSPQKAQNILVAGFPFGKAISSDLKITGGIINSLKGGGNDTTRLQIDATINPGNSGGPIVDKVNGSLVGVAVSKLNKDFTKEVFGAEGENTNYGIKASQVRDFLESNNISVSVKSSKLKISELEESTVFIYNK